LFYVLEHRYYGASQPFPDWSVANLKYLNSSQALADIDYFIKSMNQNIEIKYGTGIHKWLTIGGSYPGALSAWFKSQYTSAAAAWSSSGVINAIQDYTNYDYDLYLSTLRSGQTCVDFIRNQTNYIQQAITGQLGPDEKYYVYSVLGGRELDIGDFMGYVADAIAGAVQYGKRESMCNIFNSVATASLQQQLPVFDQYAIQSDGNIADANRDVLKNTTYDINKNQRQWMYQVCTEFGWFQEPNPIVPMRSNLLNSTYWLKFCKDIFDETIGPPAVDFYNKWYGGLNITGDKIIFANAVEDPWQYAGLTKIQNQTTQAGMKTVYINCNNCAHCVDLHTPSPADAPTLTNARSLIKQTVALWLTPTQEELE
jgi:hypothetical protein